MIDTLSSRYCPSFDRREGDKVFVTINSVGFMKIEVRDEFGKRGICIE